MNQRAFVVMPFGTVDVPPPPGAKKAKPLRVDFDRVYSELIKPALEKAGCEPFRADMEISAGDIRTDMFFELVTADVVVADVSIPNANVYYELGVRDGVCPRGVFIINGGWPVARPFDIAQDRSFKYNGRLFVTENASAATAAGSTAVRPTTNAADIHKAVEDLASILHRALASEEQGSGSPVYSHLPGLQPANWDGIETSRARYFGSLQRDWQERVRRAQELNLPGHILTIAQDAPTRIHRTKILWQAARALIGLCQFAAAEEVYDEILQLQPEDLQAQLYLGIVHAMRGETLRAEQQLQAILRQHEGDPSVGLMVGFIYRLLWLLEWKTAPNGRERAAQSPRLLLSAIRAFYNVQRDHPEQFMGGYNALLLIAVADELFPGIKLPTPIFDRNEFATVVRYATNAARQNAEETGDYDIQFWSAVALAGLELLKDNLEGTLQGIRDACAVPSATLFYLQLLKERLVFLEKLEFKTEIVKAVSKTVDDALAARTKQRQWRKVIVYFGWPCDPLDCPNPRFPMGAIPAVRQRIHDALETWKIGPGDLAVCATSSEGDVLFAEKCLERGAQVRLLVLEPKPEELAIALGDPVQSEWANRASVLVDNPLTEVWYHSSELGEPVENANLKGRHRWWIFNTARMESENATGEPGTNARLFGLVVSDGTPNLTDPEDPSFFISEIFSTNRHQGRVQEINLQHLGDI